MILLGVVLLLGLASGGLAAEPQSVRQASLDRQGHLLVDVIEAGAPTMSYQLLAHAAAVYQCLDATGACVAPVNRQELSAGVSGTAVLKATTLPGVLQGLVTGRLTALAPTETLVCDAEGAGAGGGPVLLAISYTNIQVRNVTLGTLGATFPPALSATLYLCP